MRLRKFIGAALVAILLASALAAVPPATAAPRGPNTPQGPYPGPRTGDPDVPEWSNRTSSPNHDAEGAATTVTRVTLWSQIRALLARHEV